MKQTSYHSPLGPMTILADEQALYGVWFNDQKYFGGHYDLTTIPHGQTAQGQRAQHWLEQYFAGQQPALTGLTLAPHTTAFQQRVYQLLQQVPYGQTVTYQALAHALQATPPQPQLARAVGNAIAHNQMLVLIPCHRVIGSNGALTGYAGGLDRKKALLTLEGSGC